MYILRTSFNRYVANAAVTGTTYTGNVSTARKYLTRNEASLDCQVGETVVAIRV